MRRVPLPVTLLAVACGGRVVPGAAATDDAPDGAVVTPDTGDTCTVVATSFDQSCATDSDCALVPPGGNICDPCDTPSYWPGAVNFFCELATVNVNVVAVYMNDIAPGRSRSGPGCSASCPLPTQPQCQQGTCVVPTP